MIDAMPDILTRGHFTIARSGRDSTTLLMIGHNLKRMLGYLFSAHSYVYLHHHVQPMGCRNQLRWSRKVTSVKCVLKRVSYISTQQ